jgi:catechol 2,3-dioxygenase-like lactoylglutathione lyase family enzyme
MAKAELTHIGMTVSDMDKIIDFYVKFLDFTCERRGTFPKEFIAAQPGLYKQKEGVYSDFAFLKSANGFNLEFFKFSDLLPAEDAIWNKPGYHHICLKVDNAKEVTDKMKAEGIRLYFEPAPMGDPKNNHHWVFLQDPDGNMIELQD